MSDMTELPDELIIALKKPVVFAGQDWPEIRLREPTNGDMKKIAGLSGTAATVHLMHLVSGMPIGALDLVGVSDTKKGADYLLGFIQGAQETGADG